MTTQRSVARRAARLGALASILTGCAPVASAEATPRSPPALPPDAAPAPLPLDAGALEASAPSSVAETRDASVPDAPPSVKIVTIGMHVAGGPYDEPTKEPFKRAVEPRFPEIARCWAELAEPPRQADVGVDLMIEASGGRPRVSNPRSTLPKAGAEGFVPCVVAVFETVEFPRLERGRTGVSYSLRFTQR